jgi:hypothetical protein
VKQQPGFDSKLPITREQPPDDKTLLDFLEAHPDCVRYVRDHYGKGKWWWKVKDEHYEPAFTLRTALCVAKLRGEFLREL